MLRVVQRQVDGGAIVSRLLRLMRQDPLPEEQFHEDLLKTAMMWNYVFNKHTRTGSISLRTRFNLSGDTRTFCTMAEVLDSVLVFSDKWRRICADTVSPVTLAMEILSPAELHVYLAVLDGFYFTPDGGFQNQGIVPNGIKYFRLMGESGEVANLDLLNQAQNDVPIEFGPLGKFMCIELKSKALCQRLLADLAGLADHMHMTPLATAAAIRERFALVSARVSEEFQQAILRITKPSVPLFLSEFELEKISGQASPFMREFQGFSVAAMNLFQTIRVIDFWPTMPRLLRAGFTYEEIELEVKLAMHIEVQRFARLIKQLCRINPLITREQQDKCTNTLHHLELLPLTLENFRESGLIARIARDFIGLPPLDRPPPNKQSANFADWIAQRKFSASELPEDRRDCSVCMENYDDPDSGSLQPVRICRRAGHHICSSCCAIYLSGGKRTCPECNQSIY